VPLRERFASVFDTQTYAPLASASSFTGFTEDNGPPPINDDDSLLPDIGNCDTEESNQRTNEVNREGRRNNWDEVSTILAKAMNAKALPRGEGELEIECSHYSCNAQSWNVLAIGKDGTLASESLSLTKYTRLLESNKARFRICSHFILLLRKSLGCSNRKRLLPYRYILSMVV
jgi:hypothetical protein